MKKHTWLAPTLWFALPTLLLCTVQIVLAVAPLSQSDTTFIGPSHYLRLLLSDPLFWRFFVNTLFTSLATPLFLGLVGGIFWLFLRKAPLSSPLRYTIVCGGVTVLTAVLCLVIAFPDLPQQLQLLEIMGDTLWRQLWPTLARYGLISLQSGVFACLFHYICAAIAKKRALHKEDNMV